MERLTEDNYVELAEKAIKELIKKANRELAEKKNKGGKEISLVTTSKIRNLLAMAASIYNDVMICQTDELPKEIIGRINYMKIRFIYEAGREPKVKDLVLAAKIREHIDEIGNSRKQYILFSRYMEALVAYRKFYGGEDE